MGLKSKLVDLGAADKKAKAHILESLSICAHDHVLSRKLLERFSTASGSVIAIVSDWFDLDELASYREYPNLPTPEGEPEPGERPVERLVAFVVEYMRKAKDAVVICENFGASRQDIAHWPWPPPRVACYGDDEVYHVLTPEITDPDQIEAAVSPRHHWQTGVCSACSVPPEGNIPDEGPLDEIVMNTVHLFVAAFDNTGFLVWSPQTRP
jgi:hypothetical protein